MPPHNNHPRVDDAPQRLENVTIEVSRPMVLLRLGYRRASQVQARTSALLDEITEQGRALLAPRAVCARCRVGRTSAGEVAIGEVLTTFSRSLAGCLEGCREAWLFAATLGPAIDVWIEALSAAGEMTRTRLADAYGSAAAIQLGLEIETLLGRRLETSGFIPGRRCAPGYGDWELSAQRPLLRHLDAGRIGMTLSEDDMMAPLKSISGLIGGRG